MGSKIKIECQNMSMHFKSNLLGNLMERQTIKNAEKYQEEHLWQV